MFKGKQFINRDFSWLQFNYRVLSQAQRKEIPLLERVNFLSISARNLNEFFMVRMPKLAKLGLQEKTFLEKHIHALEKKQRSIWGDLCKDLEKSGIRIIEAHDCTEEQYEYLERYFIRKILPLLRFFFIRPQAKLPFIESLSFAIFLQLCLKNSTIIKDGLLIFSPVTPRFIPVPFVKEGYSFIKIEKLVYCFWHHIISAYEIENATLFRIIRDRDTLLEQNAKNFISFSKMILKGKVEGEIVKLETEGATEREINIIKRKLGYNLGYQENSHFLAIDRLSELYSLCGKNLKFLPYKAKRHLVKGEDIFVKISKNDILLHHPYDSFDMVVHFLESAAQDPQVTEIKQTIYRTSLDGKIIKILVNAAQSGKSVTVIMELRARFEEARNIEYAKELKRAGVKVFFGLSKYKTHAKMILVKRNERGYCKNYIHISTGNYNPQTAKIYTDLSYFSDDRRLTAEISALFDYVISHKLPSNIISYTFSPINLRQKIIKNIELEIKNAKKCLPAAIWMKMNALEDPGIVKKLYQASIAGVRIELIVRGICIARPGMAKYAKNIKIKSIIGRFLEHSRIYCFGNGAYLPNKQARIYLSSADLMKRNLNHRIEFLIELCKPYVRRKVLYEIMLANILDNQQSYDILKDGGYNMRKKNKEKAFSAQEYFMTNKKKDLTKIYHDRYYKFFK